MDHHNVFVLGCVTLAVAISVFILWGPSPRAKKKKGHIVGLVNLGSTCFLNTLLQALASCALFIQWLSQQKQEENSLTSSLHQVLWVLNGQGTGDVYAPVGVLSALKRYGWMVSSGEQDAHELFNVIVSTLQEESCRAVKMGSLTDIFSTSDTLSQASELLEEAALQEELVGNPHFPKAKNELRKSVVGKGDDVDIKFVPEKINSDLLTNFEDALDKMNQGDSISHSSTAGFFSLDQDSPVSCKNDCGDIEETTMKSLPEIESLKENILCSKTNLVKSYIEKFKTSQESFKEKSPEFPGFYDRVTGCSPCIPQSDAPPFQGLLTSTLQCSVCRHCSSLRYDTFDSVSLPLSENAFHFQVQRLQDLLHKFVKTEIIPEVECEKCCKKTTAFKTLNFGKLPPCLCLRIARTAWQTYSSTPTKREDYVDFPEYLPMDDYTVSARLKKEFTLKTFKNSVNNTDKKEKHYKHMYRLKSVVVHLGGVNSGHFLTYRRGALNTSQRHRVGKLEGACMDSQRWYLTSDDSVKLSNLYEAMDSIAYMLFYEKCSPEQTLEETLKAAIRKNIYICDNKENDKTEEL